MLIFATLSAIQFFIESPWQLLVLRLLIGVVLGADYVVSKSLVTEHAPRRFRGRLMSLLAAAWATGYVTAYLVGYLLTKVDGESWRYMLAASALPALLIFGFRLGVPESPLWLTQHGRTEQAAAIVRTHLGPDVLPPPAEATVTKRRGIRVLFTPKFRKRTAVGALFYVCQVIPFFALGTFSPQVMESLGVTSKLGAGAAYNAFLLIGALLGLLVIDRISRRTFLIGTFFLGAALLMALVMLADVSPVLAVSLFASFALVLAAAVNLEFVYPPELFPPTYGRPVSESRQPPVESDRRPVHSCCRSSWPPSASTWRSSRASSSWPSVASSAGPGPPKPVPSRWARSPNRCSTKPMTTHTTLSSRAGNHTHTKRGTPKRVPLFRRATPPCAMSTHARPRKRHKQRRVGNDGPLGALMGRDATHSLLIRRLRTASVRSRSQNRAARLCNGHDRCGRWRLRCGNRTLRSARPKYSSRPLVTPMDSGN